MLANRIGQFAYLRQIAVDVVCHAQRDNRDTQLVERIARRGGQEAGSHHHVRARGDDILHRTAGRRPSARKAHRHRRCRRVVAVFGNRDELFRSDHCEDRVAARVQADDPGWPRAGTRGWRGRTPRQRARDEKREAAHGQSPTRIPANTPRGAWL